MTSTSRSLVKTGELVSRKKHGGRRLQIITIPAVGAKDGRKERNITARRRVISGAVE